VHLRIFSLFAVLLAAAVVVGGSGAGTAKTRTATKIDVSTRSAVIHYLRSIHVNPRGVVIQRGARNYAGARCPGKGWSCTSTRHAVVQVAAAGGKNAYSCTGSRCAVIQVAAAPTATNTAKCIKTTGLTQSCTINQSSTNANNVAIVLETVAKATGLTQTATYTAAITQRTTGASAFNRACVRQQLSIDGSTTAQRGKPVNVNLNAHQSVTITQDSATGDNTVQDATTSTSGVCAAAGSALTQDQTLTSTANGSGPITQNQNAVSSGPNITLDVKQNQSSGFFGSAIGANVANFTQTNTLQAIANTTVGPVIQTQSTTTGGLLAAVNQDSRGVSTASATQVETQCEDAHASSTPINTCHTDTADPPGYSLTQTQIGPMRKAPGDSFQTGNANDTFTVSQTSTQDSDLNSGKTNTIAGGVTTDGTGTVTQNTDIQGTPKKNVHQGQDTTVNGNVDCGGSSCVKNLSPPKLDSAPTNPSPYTAGAAFAFSNVDDTVVFVCSLDGGADTLCTSPNNYGTLASGAHTFSVKTKDPDNGNLSAATTYSWVITPPDPTITGNPTDPSDSSSATFTFSDADPTALFKCQLDGGGYSSCSSGVTYTALGYGQHTFDVKATDASGTYESTGAATYTWTVAPSFVWSGSQLTAHNVDVMGFGMGGMRGVGTGSFQVGGVPTGSVTRAYLYWHGPVTSTASATANANVTFNGTGIVGTNIGIADDNNWPGFAYSQSYRADVTSLVSGNGTYTLSDFMNADADINGVALIVFYDDGDASNNRNVVLWNGNDSNVASTFDPADWDETLTGVAYPGSGSVDLDLVVGDGQSYTDGALVVNGTTVAPAGQIFDGNSGPNYAGNPAGVTGSLWDIKTFDITSLLNAGDNSLHLTSPTGADALSLVVAVADAPESAPVTAAPTQFAPKLAPTAPQAATLDRPHATTGGGATR
jgi:hypothetical protein